MKTSLQAMALWGNRAPSHSITAIMFTEDQQTIVTGSLEGQICLWNITSDFKISSRIFLCGHTAPVTLLSKARDFEKQPYVASGAENGELIVWNVATGQCIESARLPYRHTSICYYHCSFRMTGEGWLICGGQYQDVLIIDAKSLEVLHTLKCQYSEWIGCMCIVHSTRIQEDSLVAVSVAGDLNVWNLSSSVNSIQEKLMIYETESKSLGLMNCQAIRFCIYTERLLLVVCSDSWKVYDYCDFSLLCTEVCQNGQRFSGGEFLAANRLIVWTEDCHSCIYQLLNSGLSKSVHPADGGTLKETISPHLLCTTDMNGNERFSCVMGYMNERKEPFYKILYSGGTSGRLSFWHIPDVPVCTFDGSPKEIPLATTLTLQDSFDSHDWLSGSVIDGLCTQEAGSASAEVTASVYIPNLDKLVCGCQDGRIIITPALHAVRTRLLNEHSFLKGSLPHKIIEGHSQRVTCLLYPHINSDKFDKSWLVSGGQDSRVIWWDVFTGEMLHTFELEAGPVVELLLPAGNYTLSICSIYSDHSVALLHLPDRKCLMHARKHLFPVRTIKYHPIEDLLIVGCEDDSVYIWDIETGTLDRHESGELAKAILTSSVDSHFHKPEPLPSVSHETPKKPSIYKTTSSHKLGTMSYSLPHTEKFTQKFPGPKSVRSPFTFLPVEMKWNNVGFHVILFDIEKLLELLFSSQNIGLKGANSYHSYDTLKPFKSSVEKRTLTLKRNKTAGSLYQSDGQAKQGSTNSSLKENNGVPGGEEASSIKRHKKMKSSKKQRSHPEGDIDINVITDVSKLLLSCFLPWGVDEELDDLCIRHLELLRLQYPASFGLVSNEDHISLMLPRLKTSALDMGQGQAPNNLFSQKVVDLSNKFLTTVQRQPEVMKVSQNNGNAACGPDTLFHLLSRILLVNRAIKMPSNSKMADRANSQQKLESILSKWKNLDSFNTSPPSGEITHDKNTLFLNDAESQAMGKLFSCWRDQPVQAIEATQAVLFAEVRRHMETFRKTSTDAPSLAIVEIEKGDTQTAPKMEQEEELQHVLTTPVEAPIIEIKEDSSFKAAHRQETEDLPDGHVIDDIESPDDLQPNPWMSKVCYCKVC
ncbi:WD repeat-containing protein 72 isoform X2 [Ambystoma mexicanum]